LAKRLFILVISNSAMVIIWIKEG